jgi:hypothetical protein
MTGVAAMERRHLKGIVSWADTRMSNGFLEALNGMFQAAKRQGARLHALRNDQDWDLPDCRQARLPRGQHSCRVTHSKFNRARNLK